MAALIRSRLLEFAWRKFLRIVPQIMMISKATLRLYGYGRSSQRFIVMVMVSNLACTGPLPRYL